MFEFALDPTELFAERTRQFVGWGLPSAVVARVADTVDDMWGDGPSAWVPAWAREAEAAEARGAWLSAALCWGAARFPCLATDSRRYAYVRQLGCYLEAVEHVPATFLRWVLEVPYRSATTSVPVHIWRRPGIFGRSLLVISGGVDTWKIELHRAALAATMLTGMTVAVLDMPGTGESQVPLAVDADEIYAHTIEQIADGVGARHTALFGISFGGHWAVKLALAGLVDAAIDLGGPVGAGGAAIDTATLPNGMAGIIGNAFGLDTAPDPDAAADVSTDFSLRWQGILGRLPVPLLAVNGAADPYVPQQDTTVFSTDPKATVWLIRNTTHCAAEKLAWILPAAVTWAHAQLEPGFRRAIPARLTRLPLTRFSVPH